MAFFDQLKRLLTKNRPQTPARHRKHVKKPGITPHRPTNHNRQSQPPIQSQPTSQPTSNEQPLQTTTSISAAVLVLYLDDANATLAQPQWLHGEIGERLHFRPQQFDDYLLYHIIGFTTTFTNPYQIMTLQFTKKLGHPVVLYPTDYDTGELLSPPITQSGHLNDPFAFALPEIGGYHMIKANRPLTGHFTNQAQVIVVMLRRSNWSSVQRVNLYVQVLYDTVIVDLPAGDPYDFEFPQNSIWRAFIRINTVHDGTWYNLGGPQWISGKNVQLTEKPPLPQISAQTKVKFTTFHASGTINYVTDQKLHTYVTPNGQAAQQLTDGTTVQITGRFKDNNQITWYRLDDNSVIQTHYVLLNNATSSHDQ